MLIGAHVVVYSEDPEADRAFFRDVLAFPFVDVGHSWLIFKLRLERLPSIPSTARAVPSLTEAASHRARCFTSCVTS